MKFSKQQIQIVVLVVIVVCGGGWAYWNYLYKPVAEDVKRHKITLEEKTAELKRLEEIPPVLERENKELEERKLEFEGVRGMLPKEKEIPSLLETITLTALGNGIDLLSFTPKGVEAGEMYDEIPIGMSIRANYHDLGRFLNEIGHLHRIVVPTVESLSGKEPTEEDAYTLSVSLTLSTYVSKE